MAALSTYEQAKAIIAKLCRSKRPKALIIDDRGKLRLLDTADRAYGDAKCVVGVYTYDVELDQLIEDIDFAKGL